jgi:hypothetical protein
MDIDNDDLDHSAHEADRRIETVIRGVIATHSGRPVDEVDTEMRLQFEVAGVTPEEPGFNDLVQKIAAGDGGVYAVPPPQGPA